MLRESAKRNARKNLMVIYLETDQVWQAADKVEIQSTTADEFKRLLPSDLQVERLDVSFCRSFESQAAGLENEFLQAAEAYCGQARDFTDSYRKFWEVWFERMESVLRKFPEKEAQGVAVCGLELPEKIYFHFFDGLKVTANRMGLTDADLLDMPPEAREWARQRQLNVPNLRDFSPRIRIILGRKFGPVAVMLCRNDDFQIPKLW